MSRRELITDHAVVRFLERYCRLDLAFARAACGGPEAPDIAILEYLVIHQGIDVPAVRRRMMTDTLRMALGMGAAGVRMGHVRLVIMSGRVVTVKLTAWDRSRFHGRPDGRPRIRRERHVQQGGGAVMRTRPRPIRQPSVREVLARTMLPAIRRHRMQRMARALTRFSPHKRHVSHVPASDGAAARFQ